MLTHVVDEPSYKRKYKCDNFNTTSSATRTALYIEWIEEQLLQIALSIIESNERVWKFSILSFRAKR